jgi:hypothetical protein
LVGAAVGVAVASDVEVTVERPPYGAYATIMGVFAGSLAAAGGVAVTWPLAAAGVNDFLQAGFTALTNQAND